MRTVDQQRDVSTAPSAHCRTGPGVECQKVMALEKDLERYSREERAQWLFISRKILELPKDKGGSILRTNLEHFEVRVASERNE